MIQKHKLDAPEELEQEHLSSASEYDRSDLSSLYPEIPVDQRPLLMSDDERHQLHDRILQRQIAEIRRSFVWIGIQLVLPVVFVLYLVALYMTFSSSQQMIAMVVIPMIIGGMITVGVWVAAYSAIVKRFSTHSLSGGAYIFTTLAVLAIVIVPLYSLVNFTNNLWITTTGLALGLAVISIVTTFLTLQLATRRRAGR